MFFFYSLAALLHGPVSVAKGRQGVAPPLGLLNGHEGLSNALSPDRQLMAWSEGRFQYVPEGCARQRE